MKWLEMDGWKKIHYPVIKSNVSFYFITWKIEFLQAMKIENLPERKYCFLQLSMAGCLF